MNPWILLEIIEHGAHGGLKNRDQETSGDTCMVFSRVHGLVAGKWLVGERSSPILFSWEHSLDSECGNQQLSVFVPRVSFL